MQTTMIEMFKKFIVDEDYEEMFVTGPAGSGKTTGLKESVEYCQANGIKYAVCAFTHMACAVLRGVLPEDAIIGTLHKYLRKRPAVNQDALKEKHVQINAKFGEADKVQVLFIDEFSNVGERDLMDLRALEIKLVWIGDLNQLPPVGDVLTVSPFKPYWLRLTKVHRQSSDNTLIEPLTQLVSFIEGAEPEPLITSERFIREQDIVEWYVNDMTYKGIGFNGVMLAYTNKQVQWLNSQAQGRDYPIAGDRLFSPTTKQYYTFVEYVDFTNILDLPFGDPLELGSKYKTLEYIHKLSYIKFAKVIDDEEGDEYVFATMFGHGDYNNMLATLKKVAAASNAVIGKQASVWAMNNNMDPRAKNRAKAWREFLSFNQAVICLDFSHAMTVHKSQGSTFDMVYLDTDDISIAANMDYPLYLKLMYVGMSRARHSVITN
jgi:hypothetical protein